MQLTVMPSLDTLDISHNKIKRLPSQPGSLLNLRVRAVVDLCGF
jgi:Leucine-rich repeat (LRR) protein